MAEPPKFPGFWSGKNIFGPDPVVESFSYTFPKTFLEGAGLPSNEPFMPPDLTTVEPTDKYSQLERDWQNLQKIPGGTRDIFNRIVGEGEPASIWPVQELFPHIEPRSSNPIRSPYPTPTTTPTERRMIRALNPPLQGDPADMARGLEDYNRRQNRLRFRPPFTGKGGLAALALTGLLWPSSISEKQGIVPMERDENPNSPTYWKKLEAEGKPWVRNKPGSQWRGEFSPLRQQLPHTLFPPNYLNEMAGRSAVEGEAEKTRQGFQRMFGLLPSTTSGALTPQELFRQRNDAEELRLREGGLPVIPEVPEWNPQASIPLDFRVNERSMAALSPPVIYNPPPGGPANLEALRGLIQSDPRVAEKYIGPRGGPVAPTSLMENLLSRTPVETFADIPAIQPGAEIPFVPPTPPAPAITEALESFTAARDTGEEQRNREQDQRERALEQAADNRRKNEEKARLESARNKKAEQARINKENRERKAEERRIASKQAKEEKQRRALEKQMEDMLRQTQETHNAYLRRKAQEEDRRRRAGYGVGAMYT